MVIFWQSGCTRAKVVVIGQKWLYLGKSCCIRAKWLYSGKVVILGQNWLYLGKRGYIPAKVVVFG